MAGGKHSSNGEDFGANFFDKEERIRKKKTSKNNGENNKQIDFMKIAIIVTIVIVVVIIGCFIVTAIKNNKAEKNNENSANIEQKMEESIEGYKVLGKIKIKDLDVEQYILDSMEDKALENGIGKIYGGALNSFGNLSLAGHNYDDMFKDLSKLEKGDEITIIDRHFKETIYKVTDKYSVEPDNLECLIPNDDKVELTLITCEDGATTRLVVKAEKVNNNSNSTNTVNNSKENV